ncbi:hypothetical protein ACFYR1_44960 [Streptomyces canus]|uniref:hypothetical protein n=1 Tax=Streptomyces canus TaxID=58343 RepID=UPI0036B56649
MAANSALHISGVADGLRVSAATDAAEVKISPGTALDSQGRVVVVAEGGVVVTDAPGGTAEEPHTLPVRAEGVALPTTGREPGDYRLTVSWREIEGSFEVLGTQQSGLLQAPWLRLVTAAESTGQQVLLAQLTLGTGGVVKGVGVGSRRAAGVTAESLELRRPLLESGAVPSVGQVTAASLAARPGGDVELNVVSADGSGQLALAVDGANRKVRIPAGVEVDSGPVDCSGGIRVSSTASGFDTGLQLRNTASGSRTYGMYAGADGGWHLADKDAASRDRLLVDQAGNVAIGSAQPKRSLHVEGTEVHSGGSAGGFSFADRTASSGAFVENPTAGQRWRWYAQGGHARLWSGTDQIAIGTGNDGDALDVPRRMRVRQGNDLSAGIWFRQQSSGTDNGLVGMQDAGHIGLYGPTAGWGLVMDTASGKVRLSAGLEGNVAIGSAQPKRSLHVEGTEVHSGGSAGGFSFADRTASSGAFVENPTAGQRWVWYAQGGHARLWSGTDQIAIGTGNNGDALDVPRRMRVRQGNDLSAGIWFRQQSSGTDNGFVGMQDNTHVGFWGSGADWGLSMDTTNGKVRTNSLETGPLNAGRVDTTYVNTVSSPGYLAESVGGHLSVEGHVGYYALSVLGTADLKNHAGYGYTVLNLTQQTPGYVALDVNGGPIVVRRSEGSSYSIWAAQAVYSNQALVSRDHIVTVDHPLDPANKTLSHSAVQAPDMTTQYDGTVVTDERGEATVNLPTYVEAFSRDFRYQLTPIADRPVVATVVRELREGSFTLRTDAPATKVCWQVSGKRHDAWARENRLVAEADKPGEEQKAGEFAMPPATTPMPATTPDMRGR